jgi:hypothetical protein
MTWTYYDRVLAMTRWQHKGEEPGLDEGEQKNETKTEGRHGKRRCGDVEA